MCNEYRRAVALGEIEEVFANLKIPLRFPEGRPNLGEQNIRITDTGTIIRDSGEAPGAAELVQRRWSWPGPAGKPVFNFKSEGREFTNRRCLIVANGFYEYTDAPADEGAPKSRKKQRWLFTRADGDWFCIAGIWRTNDTVGEAFTMLTTAPGPDIAPYHSRQIVILDRSQWGAWLTPARDTAALIRPAPAGTLAAHPL